MTPGKRALDLGLAAVLVLGLALPLAGLMALMWARQGRPILHGSERMQTPARAFTLWKLRTMRPDPGDTGVSGGDKTDRITPMGHVLRRTRGDELPQLYNILRGDISFVGPRPPLRAYVERFPALYARVLRSRPGVTGLATLVFHAREEALLAACATPGETDRVYARRCVPRKARLALLYARRRTLALDLWLIWLTVARAAGLAARGGRLPRGPGRPFRRVRTRVD